MWRSTPFAGLDVPLLADWAHRLTERRLAAYEALYQAELVCGLSADVIGELAALVREHPLRERFHELLMVALYRSGRQSEALAAYGAARERLVEELGREPGPELRELQRRMLAGEPVELGGEGQQPRAVVPAQLPGDVVGFVGWDAELAELDALLEGRGAGPGEGTGTVGVSAVAGTAGVGKTALVARWAHRVRERFPDGQLYVDLRGYGPDQPVVPEDTLAGFLRALGLDGAAMPLDVAERAARFRTLRGTTRTPTRSRPWRATRYAPRAGPLTCCCEPIWSAVRFAWRRTTTATAKAATRRPAPTAKARW